MRFLFIQRVYKVVFLTSADPRKTYEAKYGLPISMEPKWQVCYYESCHSCVHGVHWKLIVHENKTFETSKRQTAVKIPLNSFLKVKPKTKLIDGVLLLFWCYYRPIYVAWVQKIMKILKFGLSCLCCTLMTTLFFTLSF